MAERVIRHAAVPRHVFCPFCVAHFYQQQELQEHLMGQHSGELQLLRQEQLGGFRAETCPCCQAQFLQVIRILLICNTCKQHSCIFLLIHAAKLIIWYNGKDFNIC